jgi:hypothetical protein
MEYIHTMEYYSAIKNMKSCHFSNTSEIGDQYADRNNPGTERQVLHDLTHAQNQNI